MSNRNDFLSLWCLRYNGEVMMGKLPSGMLHAWGKGSMRALSICAKTTAALQEVGSAEM